VLLVGKFVFLLVLYVFILSVVRSSTRELRLAAPAAGRKQWQMPGAPAPAEEGPGGSALATAERDGEVWTLLVLKSHCIPVGAAYALPEDTRALAGRSPDMDIYLEDTFVSGKHVLFEVTEEGLRVEDLRSTNGTQLNGSALTEPTFLEAGDRVAIGDTIFQVEVR
jgi:hypothetical protein